MKRSLVPTAGRLSRVFDQDMESLVERFFAPVGAWFDREFFPRTNMSETAGDYQFSVELPGMKAEDIHVEVKDNMLSISGEKQSVTEETDKTYHCMERHHGSFRRMFQLPGAVNEEAVEANYADGVLTITVPKRVESRPRQVAVQVQAAPTVESAAAASNQG